jgi:catechol 2,3-dioxygenase-like lactoylglutathione lyase family enzyme
MLGARRSAMAFHHVAVATRDLESSHRFYIEAMGFELVKVVTGKTPEGGWSKHAFYETGGDGLMARWELHDDSLEDGWSPAISTGLGLPIWVNHLAFDARDASTLDAAKQRWLGCGHDVMEVDHGFCVSVYTRDPNGIMVEWCLTTRDFTDADREEAQRRLADAAPEFESQPATRVYRARDYTPGETR